MWKEPRWKFVCSYNEWVYIAEGDAWPLWLLDFPHERSISYDFSIDVTLQLHMCVHWAFNLHYIWLQQVWPIIVMWPRWFMTQFDMALLTCTGWLWCPCQAAMLLSDGYVLKLETRAKLHVGHIIYGSWYFYWIPLIERCRIDLKIIWFR